MFGFIAGLVFALLLNKVTGLTWILVIISWGVAVPLQVMYAHRLNTHLGGADPVAAFGTRNLKQLRSATRIPFSVTALDFAAKALGWAGVVAILITVNWWY
ncbi:MAG: hypothetical protein ACYC7J_13335 [Syntrophales bacterium]